MASGYPITASSFAVNDQLLNSPFASLFMPNNVTGPVFMGGPRGYQTIPVGVGSTLGVGGGSATDGQVAAANPWSPTKAPLVLLIGMLVGGLLILRYIHWRA